MRNATQWVTIVSRRQSGTNERQTIAAPIFRSSIDLGSGPMLGVTPGR
jgi:hypothetical protein